MITQEQYHTVLGLTTLLIQRRRVVDDTEKSAAEYLRSIGAKDADVKYGMQIRYHVGEATYNSGDDPETAAKELLAALDLEVEDA